MLSQLYRKVTAIGSILFVEAHTASHEVIINDPNAFIENGGLLALCRSQNADEILSKLPQPYEYSNAALEGLFLRDLSEKPAWILGLESHNKRIRVFTQTLKNQFESRHRTPIETLQTSMNALTPAQQGEAITTLVQAAQECTNTNPVLQTALIVAIQQSTNKAHYEKTLKT